MEKLKNSREDISYIEGFHSGLLFYDSDVNFLLSDEVLVNSNASIVSSHMMDIYKMFIKPKLKEKGLDKNELLSNSIIVLAHGKSTDNQWIIFGYKEDKKGMYIEDFLDKLPKDKKVILYICNDGGYEIDCEGLDIVYPLTNTKSENFKLKIQGDLINYLDF